MQELRDKRGPWSMKDKSLSKGHFHMKIKRQMPKVGVPDYHYRVGNCHYCLGNVIIIWVIVNIAW